MLSIDSKILSKLNVGRDRIRKVFTEIMGYCGLFKEEIISIIQIQVTDGMDKRNLLLTKEVDKENHKTTYTRHFETKGPDREMDNYVRCIGI